MSSQYFDKANVFFEKNNYDSAYYYYNKTISANTDSLLIGKSLFNMAITQSVQGDYFGSYESAIKSISFFDKTNTSYLASVYNTIAINKSDLKEYSEAIIWYKKSVSISYDYKDSLMWQNNMAVAYYKSKKYNDAKNIYIKLLQNDTILNDSTLLSKVIDNFAYTKWLQNGNYNAIPELLRALNIREKRNDFWGQNASFAHLSSYYSKKKPDSAFLYANKMYLVAKQLKSPDDQLEALQRLIVLSPPIKTKLYFDSYLKLDDSLQTVRNAAKNQFALIRYETEKNKADLLKVKAENIQKQNNILKQYFALGILGLMLMVGYWWYRKRKKILQQEKELEVKNTELKYVKKIHDKVANKVYQVMSEVENTPDLDRVDVVNKLELLYNISRDISYERDLNMDENYVQQLSKMLKSYNSTSVGIITVGNEDDLWKGVKDIAKIEIYYIIQELMTNMRKHSHADSVVLKFQRSESDINILYLDNGIGIPNLSKENGLSNTENRIKSISGTITFDSTQENEFRIELVFPFS